jgi:pimeloyl-ACP methyl ester carboxylesterase
MVVLTLFYACTNLSTAEDRYAALEGARVHYQNFGQGSEAIVFIHGYACNATFWHSQLPAFRRSGHVIALDLPGHGESDTPAVSYTQEYHAPGVAAVLNDAGVRRAYVVAHSMGMSVARYFLDKHPETVAALVNVDSRSLFYGEDVDTGRMERERFAESLRGPNGGEALRERIGRFFVPQTPSSVREEVLAKMPRTASHVAASAYDGLNRTRRWSDEPTSLPTLAIYAKPVPSASEALLRRMFTKLQYQEWDGVGHFIMMEKPDEFNRTVLSFIAGLREEQNSKRK